MSDLNSTSGGANLTAWNFTTDWDYSRRSAVAISQAILGRGFDDKANLNRLSQEEEANIIQKLRDGKNREDSKIQWTDREVLTLVHLLLLFGKPNETDKKFLIDRILQGDWSLHI
eukprot:TRINITY_DN14667_c0_g1_i1.p1 TRINITY_DN14667_c0_g1~~TRINITY_DN14667_c0_g1_i1.p1  ORF type:complete len:115 (+),score=34.62 TRINITY_DN14667_c0_g1_i1:123-467(+)